MTRSAAIFLFIFNLVFFLMIGSHRIQAQDTGEEEVIIINPELNKGKDDKKKKPKAPLRFSSVRFGADLVPLITTYTSEGVNKYYFWGDIGFTNRLFVTGEFGTSSVERSNEDSLFTYTNKGSFYRFGVEYNFLSEKTKDDAFVLGARFGLSNFDHSLSFTNYPRYWDTYTGTKSKDGLTATWVEIITGLRVMVIANFYFAATTNIKIRTSLGDSPDLGISEMPGFGKYTNPIGLGFQYHLMYRIPFRK